MKVNKLSQFVDGALKFYDDHQREIMLSGAIAGTVITAVLSWKAGIKADKVISKQKEKMNALEKDFADEEIGMTEEEYKGHRKELVMETCKEMAPIVIPPALAATGTIVSVISGYKVASKRIAILSSLYSVAEKSLTDYQDKTKEIVGPKKAQEIKDEIAADKVAANPPKTGAVIKTGKGETPVYDPKSGRYFYSSPEAVKAAVNRINHRMMEEYYVSLNEFYDELGLSDVELGEDEGFNIDDGLIDVDHIFSVTKTDEDIPVLVLDYEVSLKYTEHRGRMFR